MGWSDISDEGSERAVYGPAGDPIGWADQQYLYLHPDLAYAAVSEFTRKAGYPSGSGPGRCGTPWRGRG